MNGEEKRGLSWDRLSYFCIKIRNSAYMCHIYHLVYSLLPVLLCVCPALST